MSLNPEQKRAIRQFMHNALSLLCPEYGSQAFSDQMSDMARVHWTCGEEFEGTDYADNRYMQKAFYMWDAMQKFNF